MVASVETLDIRKRPGTGLYEIVRSTGGKIHPAMDGMYTSTSEAQKAINIYKVSIEQELVKQDLLKEKKEYILRAKIKEEEKLAKELKAKIAEEKKEAAKEKKDEKSKPGKK